MDGLCLFLLPDRPAGPITSLLLLTSAIAAPAPPSLACSPSADGRRAAPLLLPRPVVRAHPADQGLQDPRRRANHAGALPQCNARVCVPARIASPVLARIAASLLCRSPLSAAALFRPRQASTQRNPCLQAKHAHKHTCIHTCTLISLRRSSGLSTTESWWRRPGPWAQPSTRWAEPGCSSSPEHCSTATWRLQAVPHSPL